MKNYVKVKGELLIEASSKYLSGPNNNIYSNKTVTRLSITYVIGKYKVSEKEVS